MDEKDLKELLRLSKNTNNSIELLSLRLDGFEDRFLSLEDRLSSFDNRFSNIDHRLSSIDRRLVSIEKRLGNIEKWIPTENSNLI